MLKGVRTDLLSESWGTVQSLDDLGADLEKHLTSGGRMGSPQAAHFGASTLEEKKREHGTHLLSEYECQQGPAWTLHG